MVMLGFRFEIGTWFPNSVRRLYFLLSILSSNQVRIAVCIQTCILLAIGIYSDTYLLLDKKERDNNDMHVFNRSS